RAFSGAACPGLDPGWKPVRVRKTRQKNLEPRSDSIGAKRLLSRTETASVQSPGGCHGYQYSADVPCLRSVFRSLVRYDLGFLVRGAAAGSKRPSCAKPPRLSAASRSAGSMPADHSLRAIPVCI